LTDSHEGAGTNDTKAGHDGHGGIAARDTRVPALTLAGIRKEYGGLRPLRILSLHVAPGEIVALAGLDAAAAEALTGLVTGAALPDEGDVVVAGVSTRTIDEPDAWLAFASCFGIVSGRVPLLGGFSVAQNMALPLTLDIDPLPGPVIAAIERLASEVNIGPASLAEPAGLAAPAVTFRLRLARAVALDPAILLVEHPTGGLSAGEVQTAALDLRRVARARRLTVVVVTDDRAFGRSVADRLLRHEPATGAVRREGRWRRLVG
jgi:ABC-type transporter Mla maintaining outer membrane lipid asymmetry ATPase subunit MlaF